MISISQDLPRSCSISSDTFSHFQLADAHFFSIIGEKLINKINKKEKRN